MTPIGTNKPSDSHVFDGHDERRQAPSSSFLIYWCNGKIAQNQQQKGADDAELELLAGWYWEGQHLALSKPRGPFVTSGQAHRDACRGLSCMGDTAAA